MNHQTQRQRHRARRLLLQVLYQWQLTQHDLYELKVQFDSQITARVDRVYFEEVLGQILSEIKSVDSAFEIYLDRDSSQLDLVTYAVLRLATFELLYRLDVPFRVVINEALQLTKLFGAQDSHKFVNGILDKIASKHRRDE